MSHKSSVFFSKSLNAFPTAAEDDDEEEGFVVPNVCAEVVDDDVDEDFSSLFKSSIISYLLLLIY